MKTPVRFEPPIDYESETDILVDADGKPVPDADILRILNAHPKYAALAQRAEVLMDGYRADPSTTPLREFAAIVIDLAALKAAGEE